jgi:DNA-binding Lrp family transcriptional regulator
MTVLDSNDHAILATLRKNARLSNKDLARKVGLAESTCLERVRRLEQRGVLSGYHAEFNAKALGVAVQAIIVVRLNKHSKEAVEEFREHVLSLRETLQLFHVAGADDFLVHIGVRDPDHLRELVMSKFIDRAEVAHIQTELIFEHRRSLQVPV